MDRLARTTRLIGEGAPAGSFARYLLGIGLALASIALLRGLQALVPDALTFALFYPAVLIAAAMFGAGPALVALGCIVGWLLICPTGWWATAPPPLMMFNLALFVLVASFVLLIGAALRTSLAARKADAATLAEQEEKLRLAVEAGEVGLWRSEIGSRELILSPRARALLGFEPGKTVTHSDLFTRIPEADHAAVQAAVARATDPELRATYEAEFRIRLPDGGLRWLQARGAAGFNGAGRAAHAAHMVGTLVDVTAHRAREDFLQDFTVQLERLAAERMRELSETTARLEESEARYRGYCDTVEDILFTIRVEPDGSFVHEGYNSFGERRIGISNDRLVGRRLPGAMPPEMWARVATVLRAAVMSGAGPGAPFRTTEYMPYPAGEGLFDMLIVPLRDDAGRVVRLIGSSREITEQALLEEELRQAQKMQAIGQLAGGVAHDFNNLLTTITGNLELLQNSVPEGRPRLWLASAAGAAHCAATLTRQLLAFSRKQQIDRRPEDANALLDGLRDLLGRTLGPDVVLRLDLEPDAWLASMDRNQTELALLNLAVNARDAMPRGGMLTLRTRNVTLSGGRELPAGAYVEIAVADTGIGMPPEVRARAFEPFFTTKEVGKGTGLGLSQVYGLARQSGGIAEIASEPGRGTIVRLLLPRASAAEPAEAAEMIPPEDAADRGAVLLVDDNADVRSAAAELLGSAGFPVSAVASASAALMLMEGGYAPAVIVTDIVMPEMNGAELVGQARALRPGLPVLFTSGYADPASLGLSVGDDPVLRKPFSGADLVACVGKLVRAEQKLPDNVERLVVGRA